MDKKFDVKQALRVFYVIVQNGQRVGEEHQLGGVYASSDYDGYTVTLRDDAVTLSIFFHNTHRFEFKRRAQLEQFMQRIEELDRRKF